VIKITVCRIKEQNVGWDEFGTYDVKGLTMPIMTSNIFIPAFYKNINTPTGPDICCEYYDQSSSTKFTENMRERDLCYL